MPQITIDLAGFETHFNPSFFPLLSNRDRYLVLMGGAGSSKSWFCAQKIIYRVITQPNHVIGVFRKVAKTLRGSCFKLILNRITALGLRKLFDVNKTDMVIRFTPNGSSINFMGLDDVEKLKSFEGMTSAWIEEATECVPNDLEEIDRRLRGITQHYKQIILSFNPISARHWLKSRFFDREATADGRFERITDTQTVDGRPLNINSTRFISTFLDNRFLDAEYKAMLMGMTGNAAAVYREAKWGVLEGLVYEPFPIVIPPHGGIDEITYGLDFGFTNPTALIRGYWKDGAGYLKEMIYRTGMTNSELISEMKRLEIDKRHPIYADSEAPDRIEEIAQAGFNVIPAAKGQGSVQAGIDAVRSARLFSTADSPNLNDEVNNYKWATDKSGNALDVPEKFNDHAMDALRYMVFTHLRRREITPEVIFW